jgi:hypothetical protein
MEGAAIRYAATATVLNTLKVTPISREIGFATVTSRFHLASRSFLWRGPPTRDFLRSTGLPEKTNRSIAAARSCPWELAVAR